MTSTSESSTSRAKLSPAVNLKVNRKKAFKFLRQNWPKWWWTRIVWLRLFQRKRGKCMWWTCPTRRRWRSMWSSWPRKAMFEISIWISMKAGCLLRIMTMALCTSTMCRRRFLRMAVWTWLTLTMEPSTREWCGTGETGMSCTWGMPAASWPSTSWLISPPGRFVSWVLTVGSTKQHNGDLTSLELIQEDGTIVSTAKDKEMKVSWV
jgi:hypothetical protein